jgi:hypothetical protein
MKVILEFDASDEFGKAESIRAQKATDVYLAIYDMGALLRQEIKYNCEQYTMEELQLLIKIQDKFYEVLENRKINIEEELP